MEAIKHFYQGYPYVRRFQVSADVLNAGVPLLAVASAEAGLNLPSTTAVNDLVGVSLDTATYLTAQQTDSADPAALVSVDIRPDAVYKIMFSGDGTTGTAADTRTVTAAATDGLSVTTGDDWSSPTMDEGSLWGKSGQNIGQLRKITSVSSSAATITVALPNDTAVGDVFYYAPFFPMALATITLTSDFRELDHTAAVATNTAEFTCIEIPTDDIDSDQRPFAYFTADDHILKRES